MRFCDFPYRSPLYEMLIEIKTMQLNSNQEQ